MTLGQKLQQLRKARGISQEDLAQVLSVTRQTISKWELDQSTPDLAYLASISDFFEVSTDYLIKNDTSSKDAPPFIKVEISTRPTRSQICNLLSCVGVVGFLVLLVLWILFSHMDTSMSYTLESFLEGLCILCFLLAVICGGLSRLHSD